MSSVAGKYLPLQNYLKSLTDTNVILSFHEMEEILKAPLPNSAYSYQAWWVNSKTAHSHSATWLDAGYTVGKVIFGKSVQFIRNEKDDSLYEKEEVTQIERNNSLSNEEMDYIENLSTKLDKVRAFLTNELAIDFSKEGLVDQYETLKNFRRIIGNIDNDMSFIGCLLIKEFLNQRYTFSELNMALKPQGSPGLDVDETTIEGKRIIGELKTTYPYKENDLGANQKINFVKDFEKLQQNVADSKYFFVTEGKTFNIVQNKYGQYLNGITLVLLPEALSDEEFVITYR
ncbi:DUF7662 domain-containing protein [Neobacillus sp. D3-1R]|uniref:DUF7662 domain-containing protein n=1 Tax=Neobacillus sp. D3-1R TaxID=3445778 RepID=UPI003F9F6883